MHTGYQNSFSSGDSQCSSDEEMLTSGSELFWSESLSYWSVMFFTGSDYSSAFHRNGKVRPFLQLVKDTDAQKAFTDMARGSLNDQDVDILNTFTAQMYGAKGKVILLNYYGYNVFEKTHETEI